MPTTLDLGQAVKAKYPGQYDDVEDGTLGRAMQQKFPGKYDDFMDAPAPAKPPLPLGLQPQSAGNTMQTVSNQPWKASPGQNYSFTSGLPDAMLNMAGKGNTAMTRLGGVAQAAAPVAAAIGPGAFMRGGAGAEAVAGLGRGIRAGGAGTKAAAENLPLVGKPISAGLKAAGESLAGPTPPEPPPPSAPPPDGSTAVPAQYTRSLPPRAIPQGGPQTGTVPGTVEPPPAAPPAPQGSTAILGQYGKSMPPQFPPKQPPVGSLPLNPPEAAPPAQGAPPVNPPAPPQVQAAPPVESAPQGKYASDIEVQPWMKDAATAGKVKADAMHPILADRLQAGGVTADQLASDPAWNPNPAGTGWKQLAKDAGVNPRFSPRDDNTPNVILKRLGITRKSQAQAATAGGPPTMPQPVQQAQAGPAAARMSPPNILRMVANAIPKEGMGISELRESLPQLSKPELDQAVMDLYRSNKIDLDAHDFPQGETPENLARLTVPDGKGNFYIMAGRR